jgi:hypothetical protein
MSRPFRIALSIVGGLLVLVVLAVATVWIVGGRALARTYEAPPESFTAPADSGSIAAGARLATLYGCTDCHAGDLGGQTLVEGGAFGTVAAPNITRGGVAANYSDLDYERAIRHGIRPGGQSLVIMPSGEYQHLTNEDVGRIIAYVKQVPPSTKQQVGRTAGPIMRVVAALQPDGLLQAVKVDQTQGHQVSVVSGPTEEYGGYLAQACKGCHLPDYSGGPAPDPSAPPAANITPDSTTGIGSWTFEDFDRAFRQGKRPDGRELAPAMPWKSFAVATDDEVRAIYLYLRTVPAVSKQVSP